MKLAFKTTPEHIGWAHMLATWRELDADPRYYTGMSSPAAAAVVGAVTYWHPVSPANAMAAAACLFGMLALALLMNSPVRYPSFKSQTGRRPQSHRTLVVLAVFIVATIAEPVAMFLVLAFGYATSPLLRGLRGLGGRAVRAARVRSRGSDRVALGRAGPSGGGDPPAEAG